MRTDVIVATDSLARNRGGEILLQLVRWMHGQGLRVEVLALGDSNAEDLEGFRSFAPTTILDDFRREGLASIPHLLGVTRMTQGLKSMRVRHWMHKRRGVTLLVNHPMAACVIRYAPDDSRHVIGMLPDPTFSLNSVRPQDRQTLSGAAGWITLNSRQSDEVRREFGLEPHELAPLFLTGVLASPAGVRSASRADHRQPLVLVIPSIDVWDSIDHSTEIAWQLRRRVPEARIRWVSDGRKDTWLSAHDIKHAHIEEMVELVSGEDPDLLSGVSVLVRSGYTPNRGDLVFAAATAGIPVRGMNTQDLPSAAPQTRAFDVEGLVDELESLLRRPAPNLESGEALRSQIESIDLSGQASQLVELLRPAWR